MDTSDSRSNRGNSSQFTPIDENAQDYGGASQDQEMVDMSQINYDDNGEDSFDPTEFFSSFGKGQGEGTVPPQSTAPDINSDLQVSDSSEEEQEEQEEEDDGADFEEVEESQDNQDFNLDEFLQQE